MPRANRQGRTGGFTLLEMLVVLVIVATTSAIVFPNLTTLGSSVDFALKRESFEQAVDGLAFTAFRESQDVVLSGVYTYAGREPDNNTGRNADGTVIQGSLRTRSLSVTQREILPPVNPHYAVLKLPEGWRLEITDPVYFHSSGYCDGGNIEVTIGRLRFSYTLAPPLCQAARVE